MNRPLCPHCGRAAVVANSHVCGELRIKFLGCVRCRVYDLGKTVVAAVASRTRTVIGKQCRDSSGRFAAVR